MNTENTAAPTITDLDNMTDDERWLGFGYLGERERCEDAELVTAVDALVIGYATRNGWNTDDLFEWANSKLGRWFGDSMFGGTGDTQADFDRAIRENLVRVPR